MPEVSLLRLARTRPVLFAALETLLTGACALGWFAFAALLRLEGGAHAPQDPLSAPAGVFFVLACAAAASLVLTWALRCLPSRLLRRFVDRLILVRAGAAVAVCLGALVFAIAY
ncbi:hypothetical protein AB0I00_37115 [Streptomyces sp. NPDC050803]|uniref:hypothetical protein n=1 Tax=unclassified Streptomyces TaxID=2593676 RepID=UPI0034128996